MDAQTISAALGAAVSLTILLGLVVKFALMPYLERHLIAPVKQTNDQLTVNHHQSSPPTIRDQLDSLRAEVRENTVETSTMSRMFDGHLDWSQREVDRIWRELDRRKERDE